MNNSSQSIIDSNNSSISIFDGSKPGNVDELQEIQSKPSRTLLTLILMVVMIVLQRVVWIKGCQALFTKNTSSKRNGRACNDSDIHEKEEQHNNGQCDLFDDPAQEPPVCKIRRFEMIKYSFGQEEEYVAIKEYI
ncbi:hypothetical protein Tco_0733397 [Tanacetum coccineum]